MVHTVKPLEPEPSAFDVGMTIGKLKRYKSSGIDQIPAELIKQGAVQFALRSINLFILFGLRRIVPEEWKESIIVPIYKKGVTSSCSKYRGMAFCPLCTKIYPTSCSQG